MKLVLITSEGEKVLYENRQDHYTGTIIYEQLEAAKTIKEIFRNTIIESVELKITVGCSLTTVDIYIESLGYTVSFGQWRHECERIKDYKETMKMRLKERGRFFLYTTGSGASGRFITC